MVVKLYNCETFGDYFAKDLGTTYFKLFKSCVNVHSDNPIYLVLLEWGLPPIKAVIYCQWLNFYKRFSDSIQENSYIYTTFRSLLQNFTRYSKYLIGPFSAGPFLTLAPLTPALIPPVLKMMLTPIRAGVKRATNFSKSCVKRSACFGRQV